MRHAPRFALLIASILLFNTPAVSAQTGTPTSYTLRVYAQGATTPTTTLTVLATAVICGQAKVTGGSTENPTQWRWDDRADSTKQCVYADATRFTALADGSYTGTVTASNTDGASP